MAYRRCWGIGEALWRQWDNLTHLIETYEALWPSGGSKQCFGGRVAGKAGTQASGQTGQRLEVMAVLNKLNWPGCFDYDSWVYLF